MKILGGKNYWTPCRVLNTLNTLCTYFWETLILSVAGECCPGRSRSSPPAAGTHGCARSTRGSTRAQQVYSHVFLARREEHHQVRLAFMTTNKTQMLLSSLSNIYIKELNAFRETSLNTVLVCGLYHQKWQLPLIIKVKICNIFYIQYTYIEAK